MNTSRTALCGVISGLLALTANAAVIMTAVEGGGNVSFNYTGAMNLTAWSSAGTSNRLDGVQPDAFVAVGATAATDDYNSPVDLLGPSAIGLGTSFIQPDSSSGDYLLFGFSAGLNVPTGYVSGTALTGSATYVGESIASLGMAPGSYVWSWGSGGSADSFTLNVIPEPSSALLSLVGIAAVGLRRRR